LETGAVTLALPQDVQAQAFDCPDGFLEPRTWTVPRNRPDAMLLAPAAEWIRSAERPLIIAGGGVIYSGATAILSQFAAQTGIPAGETQAGKGSLCFDHPQCVGAMGVTGTSAANRLAREADLIIGIGTRYSDFTTASVTAFQNAKVRFININTAEFDAYKHAAVPLVGDAAATIEELAKALGSHRVSTPYAQEISRICVEWNAEVDRIYARRVGPPLSQGEVIGLLNSTLGPKDVIVCAAGSLPGDLHKLWRTRDPKGYHLEYGYSCMGYEIAGGLGVKMADPSREVYVLVGDGSYLMMAQEIVTSLQEKVKLNIVLLDNHGFSSIGGLSRACGSGGFGTEYRSLAIVLFVIKVFNASDRGRFKHFLPVDNPSAGFDEMSLHCIVVDRRSKAFWHIFNMQYRNSSRASLYQFYGILPGAKRNSIYRRQRTLRSLGRQVSVFPRPEKTFTRQ
jgi:3D-(3,5/4)-trihydroxycyclohexane-1,2-dione acylhydrolase (decyclizing)